MDKKMGEKDDVAVILEKRNDVLLRHQVDLNPEL